MIEAAIFDMDGLLIDSEPIWRASHIAALGQHGVIISEDEARVMAGKRTDEVVRHWRQTKKLEHVPNEHLEAVIGDAVIKSIRQHGKELPGVHHVINLFEQHNIPMAVASSSSPEIIEAVLNKLDLAKYMKITYSAKHEKFGKPHPGVFLTTAKKLSVSPENCIVFEDALYGIRAAKAAGMKCVGVPEFANAKKPEFQEADILVPSLEVITWAMLVRLFES
jgi:HAD superfamily hydrolase (TIGR01509 family)